MLLGLLLSLNILVCLALIGVVLLQRSEGGALGGGSPTGLITTRGAGDLLTRTTWILFSLFLTISLALTIIGGHARSSQAMLNRLKLQSINPDSLPAPTQPQAPGSTSQSAPPPVQTPALPGTATTQPGPSARRAALSRAPRPVTANPILSLPPLTSEPASPAPDSPASAPPGGSTKLPPSS